MIEAFGTWECSNVLLSQLVDVVKNISPVFSRHCDLLYASDLYFCSAPGLIISETRLYTRMHALRT